MNITKSNFPIVIMPPLHQYYKGGVYKLLYDEKYFYFGSSKNLYTRITSWAGKCKLPYPIYQNHKLRTLVSNFEKLEIFIIELCDPDMLKEREDFHIKSNFGSDLCLNVSPTAYGNLGTKRTAAQIKNMSQPRSPDVPQLKPLYISKTQQEWDIITKKIYELGKKDLSVFIRSEVRKLKDQYQSNEKNHQRSTGTKIEKRPYIPEDSYEKLKVLSDQMQIPVSSVVDRLIIQPLLIRP